MIEILSPAGTYESFQAAVAAGADAIYLGGSMFGARAFAGNFQEEELLRAIDYAHIHDRKVYLTVNTLLKESEQKEMLYSYLLPYYKEGLDAVIVQDYGVFMFIKENFKGLDIHASTQMTVTGHNSARLLQKMGASRIVTARELNLSEIRKIHEETGDLEIESFVHGALCYCYSGQCLMSSLIGGRSGNRGRCAQACRLPYEVLSSQFNEKYILSQKDMCALDILPQVIEAGVNSLKIEGRMKSPEYTAGVVSMYRKYVDMYLAKGSKGYKVSSQDKELLMDLYNRGSFTQGYYTETPGKNMMSMSRPNHQGVAALQVISSRKGNFIAKALTTLNAGDVIEVTPEYEITIGAKDASARQLSYNIPSKFFVEQGKILYRTRNTSLIDKLRSEYLEKTVKRSIRVSMKLKYNQPVELIMFAGETSVAVSGDNVIKALNKPVTVEQMKKQISKLGDTPFVADCIEIDMDDDVFIPVGVVNELRRKAVDVLVHKLIARDYRVPESAEFGLEEIKVHSLKTYDIKTSDTNSHNVKTEVTDAVKHTSFCAYISREEQIEPVLSSDLFSKIYIDIAICNPQKLIEIVKYCRECTQYEKGHRVEIYLALTHIFRDKAEQELDSMADIIRDCKFDGFLVKSLCELEYLRRKGYAGKIVTDHNLYVFNEESKKFLYEQDVDLMTMPVELNEKELSKLASGMEIIGYGYYPMMVSAQCVRKCAKGCQKGTKSENEIWYLKDRKSKRFPIVSNCRYCYTTIYNEAPVYLMDKKTLFEQWNISAIRVEFTIEDYNETKKVIDCIRNGDPLDKFTRGHFTRGVE